MSRFCSLLTESVELSLDLSLLLSCVKHVLGRFSHVFCEFPTSAFRCSPLLDLRSFMVKSVDLGLGCSPLDPRSTMVRLGLPCISSVFWIEGSTVLVIAAVIASRIWEFKLVLIYIEFSRHLIGNYFVYQPSGLNRDFTVFSAIGIK